MTEERFGIIVVDDEANVLKAVTRSLRALPLDIQTTTNAYDALAMVECRTEPLAVVMSDQRMPGMDGLEFLRRMRELQPNAVRILFTAYAEMDVVIRSINIGEVFRFVRKPWDETELQAVVLGAIQHHKLVAENERLLRTVRKQRQTLEELETEHPGLTKLPPRDETGAFVIEPPEGMQDLSW